MSCLYNSSQDKQELKALKKDITKADARAKADKAKGRKHNIEPTTSSGTAGLGFPVSLMPLFVVNTSLGTAQYQDLLLQ